MLITYQDFCAVGAPRENKYHIEALEVLAMMANYQEEKGTGGGADFVKNAFVPLFRDPSQDMRDPQRLLDEVAVIAGRARPKVTLKNLNARRAAAVFVSAISWTVAILRPDADESLAISSLQMAQRTFGVYVGIRLAEDMGVSAAKLAGMGAHARHKVNRQNRSNIFAWCDENMGRYNAMDKAAMAAYEKEVVIAEFKTIRKWMTEWKKARKN
jgi:hypothetical protein